MYSLRGQPLTNVSVDHFLHEASRHLRDCSRAFWFWWPIIHARAEHHRASAADLLLNPLFRWVFLNRWEKLAAFEEAGIGVMRRPADVVQLVKQRLRLK